MVLILYRDTRAKLLAADTKLSPERALDHGPVDNHPKERALLARLDNQRPSLDPQMSLLWRSVCSAPVPVND
jgi:hypothetical protein